MNELAIKKALLTCPGDTIKEHIDHIGLSHKVFAAHLGWPLLKLNQLMKGKVSVSKEVAIRLEYVLGVPASFWLNLERRYHDELLELKQLEQQKTF